MIFIIIIDNSDNLAKTEFPITVVASPCCNYYSQQETWQNIRPIEWEDRAMLTQHRKLRLWHAIAKMSTQNSFQIQEYFENVKEITEGSKEGRRKNRSGGSSRRRKKKT